jgi:quinol monooxygenase YgiN
MSTVTVVGRLVAKTEKRAELVQLLQSVIEPIRREEGILHYSIHQELESPDVFVAIERWHRAEDLQKHMRGETSRQLAAQLGNLLAEPPDITTYQPLGEENSDEGELSRPL